MNKEYILIKEGTPDEFVPAICAHAALIGHLQWHAIPAYQFWLMNSFKKVVCKINTEEFNSIKDMNLNIKVVTESALQGKEVAIVVMPNISLPKEFKQFKLWKSNLDLNQ